MVLWCFILKSDFGVAGSDLSLSDLDFLFTGRELLDAWPRAVAGSSVASWEKPELNGGLCRKIIDIWGFFHCHV